MILSVFCAVSQPCIIPSAIKSHGLASIKYAYREQFSKALHESKIIIKKFPNHPAGYFFYAAVLNVRMEYLQSDKYEAEFYRYSDLAILKGERLLQKKSGNHWVKFFIAGVNGSMGTYESRYERWITAFKHGWRAVVLFREIENDQSLITDGLFGIASYNYWRSAKTKLLWWMPGVGDNREKSIHELYKISKTGIFVRESSLIALIDILLNESRYNDALEVSNVFLKSYPQNLTATWGKIKALAGLKKYKELEDNLLLVCKRISNPIFTSNFNQALYHYFTVVVLLNNGNYDKCVIECNAFQRLTFSDATRDRLKLFIGEISNIKREALKKKK